MVTVQHIRARLRPRRGNEFYLDRSERVPATLCGAPCGNDFDWRSKPVAWTRSSDGAKFEPCALCVALKNGGAR